jgi:hypothetical protein
MDQSDQAQDHLRKRWQVGIYPGLDSGRIERKVERPYEPTPVLVLHQRSAVAPLEHRVDRVGLPKLRVAVAQHMKRVVIKAEPDVEPMLLDALAAGVGRMRSSAAGALAPEPPTSLIDRDAITAPQLIRAGKLVSRRERGHAAPQDDHRLLGWHSRLVPVDVYDREAKTVVTQAQRWKLCSAASDQSPAV